MRSLVALGLTVILGACASTSPQAGAPPTATGGPTATPAGTAPTATSAPAAAATASVSPESALVELLRGGRAVAYKVTYTMTTTGGGQSTSATFSQAFKPPYFRTDIVGATPAESFTTLVRPEATYLCGALLGSPACFTFSGGGPAVGAQLPSAPQPIPSDLTGWGLVPTSARTIAGQSAQCFTFTSPTTAAGPGVETIGCYTPQGIPLFMSTKSAGTEVTMTATSFSTTVSEADFAVPFPVQKLPGQ